MAGFGLYPATIVATHDGDTIRVDIVLSERGHAPKDIDLGFNIHRTPQGIVLKGQAVRLFGCNAPELATPEGKDALAYLQKVIVSTGDRVQLTSHGWDKYGGRVDGSVTLGDGRDLTQVMIDAGHAKAWDGTGPKPV